MAMPSSRLQSHQLRVLLRRLPFDEEGGADAVPLEDVEDLRRVRRVGAIVEREGDDAAAPLSAADVRGRADD